ncbi:efflux RND transporter permease subunit [Glaciecola petra]|uniref:Efflux RND transporter permease subunit n=1 Tax=Glaciecola petra TaxID=3075602 RepID=A0ABU2ZP28_9ALTE|nr:efflux RND transporter permease subunit [Aestuariibacter sp. P117]MDT0594375.1 efflux RND transporter permease subunit [Aestuariibacter sp. P117]
MNSKIDTNKGIVAWFARNNVAANLLMIIIIAGGIAGIFKVQKQIFPQFVLNLISVQVPYLGAAPQEVEEGVILRIEEAIKDLEGIKKITSTSREGLGSVTIEVLDNYDVQDLLDEIKVQVDAISTFPANTEKPVVYRLKAQQDVLWVSVYGDVTERELKELTKSIRDEIANLDGISDVGVFGARDYEVSVEIAEVQLQAYDLTFDDVVAAIRRSSVDIPGGSIRSDNGDILLRAKGQAYSAWDFAKIPLINRSDGTRLLIGDIASINDGFVEDNNFARFDGKTAMNIRVRAVGDQNALEISKNVNEYLDKKRTELPANVQADSWGDSSFYLNDRLSMMLWNMLQGAVLVFIVLSIFLKLKLAAWVMVGLPVCFLGTLMVMPMDNIDVSINLLSLFGFILVLGIVVDDAIIMGESAYAEIDKNGHSLDNVIRGVQKVAMPATFGVLTTIAAFSPMLMVSGTFGVIWKTIGMVVILCLVFSLIESKLILPAHLGHMKVKPYDPKTANGLQRARQRFNEMLAHFIKEKYGKFLIAAVKNRYTTLTAFLAMFIVTIGLFAGGQVRFVFFPNIPSDFMIASIEMEAGSSLKQRDLAIEELLRAAQRMNKQIIDETGAPAIKHSLAFDNGPLSGQLFVELTKGETRELTDKDMQDIWRNFMPEIPGVRSLDIGSPGGPGGGSDLSFEFSSNNIQPLKNVTKELKSYLEGYNGVTEVNDSFSGGSDEIQLEVKPQAEALGISLSQLAQQVRYGFYGAEAQRIQREDEEVKVMVRYPKEDRNSIGNLENMRVRAPNGDDVPFNQVADVRMSEGYASIIRVDGSRSITVNGKVNKDIVDPGEVASTIMKDVIPEMLERYPEVTFKLQGISKEQSEATFSLAQGFLFALFMIFALMAIPLKSYSQPLIIMSVIPFGLVGAVIGHLIMGEAISVLSICGIIALAGVVVNDSLIMVDFVNRARKEGYALLDAVYQAGTQRFRAIILTSLTTFMGLLPILFEKSLQAQIVIPMAISLAFGILFATIITLLLVPSLYLILDDIKNLFRGKKHLARELPKEELKA